MNPRELEGKYARLQGELASLERSDENNKARRVRLACELDQIDRQREAFRRLAEAAPTLRDVVMTAEPRGGLQSPASVGADASAEMIRSGMAWALTKYLVDPQFKAIEMEVGRTARAG